MQLTTVTSYRVDGHEFKSLKAAREHIKNEIGRILDASPIRMDPKTALAVFGSIVKNRARLVDLLTVEVEQGEDDPCDTDQNLLTGNF